MESDCRVAKLLRDRDTDHHQDEQHEQLLHARGSLLRRWSVESVPYGPVSVISHPPNSAPNSATNAATNSASGIRFEERLRPTRRGWLWLPPIIVVTFLAIAPLIVPLALIAWFINVGRFWRVVVRIDDDYLWVGRRWARLATLDLTTLGRAQNTWPWRTFSPRWLGGNPLWTRDSVGVRGFDGGKPYWVSVGTNRRDEFVTVLAAAVAETRERGAVGTEGATSASPPCWHPDPWDPVGSLRWWDGTQWTGWTWPRPGGSVAPS